MNQQEFKIIHRSIFQLFFLSSLVHFCFWNCLVNLVHFFVLLIKTSLFSDKKFFYYLLNDDIWGPVS